MTSGTLQMRVSDPDVDEESVNVRTRDGALLELRVYRIAQMSPTYDEQEGNPSPLIVLFHGGHHVLGHAGMLSTIASSLSKRFNAVVVSASYRLAPEHPFPTGVNDAWDVLSYCAANAKKVLYADPTAGFIVGGVSSGGSMSISIAHMARDQNMQPPLTGLYLASASARAPNNDGSQLPEQYKDRFLSRSQEKCVNDPVLPANMVNFMDNLYQADKTSELYAPLMWPTGHKGLPPTYTQICGIDTSRDENLILADMLKKEDVSTRVDLYSGLPHAFWGVLPSMPQAKKWSEDTLEGFQWLLQKTGKCSA